MIGLPVYAMYVATVAEGMNSRFCSAISIEKKAMNILSYSIKLCVLWTNSSEWNEFKVHILNNIRHKLEHPRFYFKL